MQMSLTIKEKILLQMLKFCFNEVGEFLLRVCLFTSVREATNKNVGRILQEQRAIFLSMR